MLISRWLEYSGINYNFKERNSLQYQHILYDGKCFPPPPNRPVQSIRHIGNSDMELPGISLYRHENFTGEELYFDGTMLQLPISITFQSFGFTGQESWTLYSGTDFTGESNVCLQPQRVGEVVPKKDILDSQLIFTNAHTRQTLYVGSIRRGCKFIIISCNYNGFAMVQTDIRQSVSALSREPLIGAG